MGGTENSGGFLSSVSELIGRFFVSAIFPVLLCLILALILFLLLRKLYRKLRFKHLPQLTYERSFKDTGVWQGEDTELTETVSNHGFFPMFAVDCEAYIYNELRLSGFEPPLKDGMQFFGERFSLWPFMRLKRRHRICCLRRGYYKIESVSVPSGDDEYFFSAPCEIYVYPKAIPVDAALGAAGRMQGENRSSVRLYSDPFTLSGVREYRCGDPASAINFKASARTWAAACREASPLKVNARDFCADRRLLVFMDFHLERECGIDGEHYSKRVEAGLSYACALIREAIYGGFAAGFFCNCRQSDGAQALRFYPAGGEDNMFEIFRAMARLYPQDGASYLLLLGEAAERGYTGCEIYSIELCPSEKTSESLERLELLGNSVREIVLSQIDEELYDEQE